MQRFLNQFALIGMASLLLSPVAALSREPLEMPQKDAEEIAKMVFQKDIRAGKITQKQAGEYYKCTEDDYFKNYINSPEGRRHMELLERMTQMSASEKSEMDVLGKTLKKLHQQSEDKCAKQLSLKIKPQTDI
jgi:tRNA C32,U32 (ribose-2'-O)-methylase TrmJ